ncbi:hypothetical protein [Plectonema radiosum]|nr:hypothetical protein [Plectonema radiosum]
MGISAVPHAASAETVAQLPVRQNTSNIRAVLPLSQIRVADLAPYPRNPCPSIWYERPYSQRVVVPAACPANTITQRLATLELLDDVRTRTTQTGTPGVMGAPYRDYPNETY